MHMKMYKITKIRGNLRECQTSKTREIPWKNGDNGENAN